jgi:hypothetical protein
MYKAISAALVLAALVSAISAGTALAAPEWYVASPEWQQGGAPLVEATATKWKGKVSLAEASEGVDVECEAAGEGPAKPGASGEVTALTMSGCAPIGGGECGSASASAVGLPWHTELVVSEGALRLAITGTGGSAGFKLTCKILGVKVTSTCTGTLGASVKAASSGVEASLSGREMFCNISGKRTGTLEGAQVIEAAKGSKLEATAKGAFAKVATALEVSRSGELTIEDRGFSSIGADCNFVAKGVIEAHGLGTITSFVAQSCSHTTGACSTLNSVSPVHLPWKTELYEAEGSLRERIVSGGSGTPEWSFSCKVSGVNYEDSCSLGVSPPVENLAEEVKDTFSEISTPTTCSKDGGKKEGVWSGGLTVAPPANEGAVAVKK